MKKTGEYILLGVIVVLIVLAGYVGFNTFSNNVAKGLIVVDNNDQTNTPREVSKGLPSIETGTTGPGDVSVELTPLGVVDGKFKVDIAVNTHSVSLGQFDVKEITTLRADGVELKPVSAPTLNGHHAGGTLVFDLSDDMDTFTITINGIPKVDKRIFQWAE